MLSVLSVTAANKFAHGDDELINAVVRSPRTLVALSYELVDPFVCLPRTLIAFSYELVDPLVRSPRTFVALFKSLLSAIKTKPGFGS